MNRSIFARFTSLCLVFVPAVSACGITDIAGDVDGGSVGGQTNVGGSPGTDVGGQTSVGGNPGTDVGGTSSDGGAATSPTPSGALPCDILQSVGNPCVAAHSTIRVLITAYTGPLYQVCKGTSDPGPSSCKGTAQDIGSVGGYADAATQDSFCSGATCYITKIYDQTANHNDLEPAPPGGNKTTPDYPALATALPTTINDHKAYGIKIRAGTAYRTGCTDCNIKSGIGVATGDQPETVYMVSSQQDLVNGCCFDYGNAETTAHDDGNGTAEAVYFGMGVIWGTGAAPGPWVMADLENGIFAGWENKQDKNISTNTSLSFDFVTAILVGDTANKNAGKGRFALYGGDATSGGLKTMYDGIRPEKVGYVPMLKEGSIVLGTAGDNSASDGGRFYEGVMASGAATKQTLDALQASIVAAKYGSPLACVAIGNGCQMNEDCCSGVCKSASGGFLCGSSTI